MEMSTEEGLDQDDWAASSITLVIGIATGGDSP